MMTEEEQKILLKRIGSIRQLEFRQEIIHLVYAVNQLTAKVKELEEKLKVAEEALEEIKIGWPMGAQYTTPRALMEMAREALTRLRKEKV